MVAEKENRRIITIRMLMMVAILASSSQHNKPKALPNSKSQQIKWQSSPMWTLLNFHLLKILSQWSQAPSPTCCHQDRSGCCPIQWQQKQVLPSFSMSALWMVKYIVIIVLFHNVYWILSHMWQTTFLGKWKCHYLNTLYIHPTIMQVICKYILFTAFTIQPLSLWHLNSS